MDYELLGKNIRKFRLQAGIKQEELAEQVDCTGSHIGQIERGRGVPSLEMVVRIANALHVTVDQLLLEDISWIYRQRVRTCHDRIPDRVWAVLKNPYLQIGEIHPSG